MPQTHSNEPLQPQSSTLANEPKKASDLLNSTGPQSQRVGDVEVSGKENATAFINAAGQATVDQSRHHTIVNYFYREETVALPATPTPDNLPCPYRGLFHFGPDDADFFFGREVFISALTTAVEQRAFIPVLGASGSGKSSVVLAGLVPRLQQSGHWQFTHFRPGEDPFHALALALIPLCAPNLNTTEQMVQTQQLAHHLQSGEVTLRNTIATLQQRYPRDRILLIADQFEELYTLVTDDSIRRQFLDCLLTSLPTNSQCGSPLVLVATLRADFLSNALTYRPFADLLQQGDIKLGAMNTEELRQVIEKPTQSLGIGFEDGLIKRILHDVTDEPGNLPLLEFALTELWKYRTDKQLTHTAYEAIGEVKGSLARHAEAKYNALSAAEKSHVQRIFVQLVHPGQGTEDTRRVATKLELGATNWSLVKQLADARLVVTSLDTTQQETVEVVHEALISNWERLQQWMETDREFRVWQDQLRTSMQQWESTQQDEGALLRGVPLAEAEENLYARQQDLSPAAQTFIRQSLALKKRQEKREKQRLKKLRSLLILTSSVAAIAALLGLVALRQSRIAVEEANAAEAARQAEQKQTQIATGAKQQAENQEAVALSQYSQVLYNWNKDKIDSLIEGIRAGVALKQVSKIDPKAETQVKIALQQAVYGVSERNRLQGHDGGVQAVTFSPDGETLATAGRDNSIKLWQIDGQPLLTLNGHQDVVWSVGFSPDGKTIASASRDRTVRLWNTQGKELQVLQGHDGDIYSVGFSPDGQTIATASEDKTVKLWDLEGNLLQTLTGHQDSVNSVAFSPNGQTLASGSRDRTIKLWTIDGQEAQIPDLRTLEGHEDSVQSVSFSPDGKELASASADKTIKLWSLEGDELRTLAGHTDMVWGVTYSPDGKSLASVGRVNQVKLWRRDGQEIQTLKGHDANGDVWGVSFSPDGTTLATAGRDATVKLWTINRKVTSISQDILVIRGHKALVEQAEFSPDGQSIASASWDRTIKLWNLKGEELQTFKGHSDDVWDVNFSPDGKTLASTGRDLTIKLWNLDGEELQTIQGPTDGIEIVTFSPDGKILATASWDNTAKLWDLQGQVLQTLRGHTAALESIAFSPDGKTVVTGSWDKTAKLWNVRGQEIKTLTGHTAPVESVSFSPDGKTVVTTSWDNTAKLWNLKGEELQTLFGHDGWVRDADFSPDGTLLATASVDQTVRLWEKNSNGEFQFSRTLWAHGASVNSVDFSSDGKYLVSSDSSGSLVLGAVALNLTLDDLLDKGCLWVEDYLKNSPYVSETDRDLCK